MGNTKLQPGDKVIWDFRTLTYIGASILFPDQSIVESPSGKLESVVTSHLMTAQPFDTTTIDKCIDFAQQAISRSHEPALYREIARLLREHKNHKCAGSSTPQVSYPLEADPVMVSAARASFSNYRAVNLLDVRMELAINAALAVAPRSDPHNRDTCFVCNPDGPYVSGCDDSIGIRS